MPATITATGTFTDLIGLGVIPNPALAHVGTAPGGGYSPNTRGNEPDVENINFDALKTRDGVIFDELRQFIQLVQVAYGLNFWPAASLVQTFLRAYMQTMRTGATLGDAVSPNRLYVP